MGSIFGGGGSGTSKTTASSEIPAELKPLASSSVKQIQAAQEALPLANFASSQPQQVAGLSPFTVAGMQLVPSLTQMTAPEQAQLAMHPVWQDLMNRAVNFTPPSIPSATPGVQNFMPPSIPPATAGLFDAVGGPGLGRQAGDPLQAMFAQFSAPQAASMPQAQASQPSQGSSLPFQPPALGSSSVFGGSPVPIPAINEAGPSFPVTPLMPTAPIAPPQAAAATSAAPSMDAIYRAMLGVNTGPASSGNTMVSYAAPFAQERFDALVALGHDPAFAAEEARRQATMYDSGSAP